MWRCITLASTLGAAAATGRASAALCMVSATATATATCGATTTTRAAVGASVEADGTGAQRDWSVATASVRGVTATTVVATHAACGALAQRELCGRGRV